MIELDLSGQTVIVTGAGRGIGAAIADRFAEAGANVVAAARSTDEIEAVASAVAEEHGIEAIAVETDLRSVEDIDRLVERSVDAFGVPEILINNAGANLPTPPIETPIDDVDTMLDVNLRGSFLLTQRWARAYRDAGLDHGRVINISSGTGTIGVPRMTLYGGTNAGINGITRGWAAALAPDGVTVNAVTPGLVGIDRIRRLLEEQGDAIYDLERIPLGRLAEPVEIADACLFYASDLADYVTGTELYVDGGMIFTAGLYR